MRGPGLAEALPGWAQDNHEEALWAYAVTADLLGPNWPVPAESDTTDPKGFFERHFVPGPARSGLLTGYYEPEIEGRTRSQPGFRAPLYAPPLNLTPGQIWHSRAAIETGDLLAGRELVFLTDAVEAFMAQVQGSVRVRLETGETLRLGYAGKNGHPYRSIGAELIRLGEIAKQDMSAQAIRTWCRAHPERVAALLRHNPSFVFFQILDVPPDAGPLGTMGRSVTAGRSLAVDPEHFVLGAPIWVRVDGRCHLMIAQDTGSAIKGAGRGDIFFGSGAEAGQRAGELAKPGELVPLLPAGDL